MAQDWDIRARSDACTACRHAFEDRQSYVSALFRGEDGFERGDFCLDCWSAREGAEGHAPYSAWQGLFRVPPATPVTEPLKKETAESLLRALIEVEDPAHVAVIYILAVMLERKKTLVEKDVTVDDDGAVHRVYEHRQSGETFVILDPGLDPDRLGDVQASVAGMLGAPAATPATPAGTDTSGTGAAPAAPEGGEDEGDAVAEDR